MGLNNENTSRASDKSFTRVICLKYLTDHLSNLTKNIMYGLLSNMLLQMPQGMNPFSPDKYKYPTST